mgnify:CR=1 FL=1
MKRASTYYGSTYYRSGNMPKRGGAYVPRLSPYVPRLQPYSGCHRMYPGCNHMYLPRRALGANRTSQRLGGCCGAARRREWPP